VNSSARGFDLTGRSWPQAARGEPVTLTYSYSNLLDGGLRNAAGASIPEPQILAAVEEAFSMWSSVAPLSFTEVPDQGGPPPPTNYGPGQFGAIRLGYGQLDGRGTFKAQANFPPARGVTSCNLCGDVLFDVEEPWETIGTLDLPDILGAAIHEIGHSLGLGHSAIDGANMFPVFRRHTGPGSGWLHPDDIAGIQAIYGQGTGSVTPLVRVPEPAGWGLCAVAVVVATGSGFLFRGRREKRIPTPWA
jgi:hypothetical protein